MPQNILFFIQKTELFVENSCSWISKNVKRYNFQFQQNLRKIHVKDSIFSKFAGLHPARLLKHELFHWYFSYLLFRNTYLRGHLWVAARVYFNKEVSQRSAYFPEKYYSRKYLKVKIPNSKLYQGEYLILEGSTYLLLNNYCVSSYFPVNNY